MSEDDFWPLAEWFWELGGQTPVVAWRQRLEQWTPALF
jgi:hypothetical protein